jgi:hypothetical protein
VNSAIERFLRKIDDDLSPLRSVIERLASSDADVEPATGALRLSHRPDIGADAYSCVLYPGLGLDVIDRYEAIHRERLPVYLDIPPFYKNLLSRMNGAYLFSTALFGIPQSMAQNPPSLDRSVLRPLDVSTANHTWRLEYRVSHRNFYFASGSHSSNENVGYFLTPENRVEAYLVGERKIGEWAGMNAFLSEELERAELGFR